jgi:hypothetical protein
MKVGVFSFYFWFLIIFSQTDSDAIFLLPDELVGFEETWQRNSGANMPGWDPRINMFGNGTAPLLSRDVLHMLYGKINDAMDPNMVMGKK